MNQFKLISEVLLEADRLLEADLEENGAGFNKAELRKVISLTEADFTESYDNADDAMQALLEYCKTK
jgi:hypothetical protein